MRWFADLARNRATRAVARDLGVPEQLRATGGGPPTRGGPSAPSGRLGPHLAIDECSVRKNFVYATVFSDRARGVVIDMAPERDASAVPLFASLFSHRERIVANIGGQYH